jgi:hypothetical protein
VNKNETIKPILYFWQEAEGGTKKKRKIRARIARKKIESECRKKIACVFGTRDKFFERTL